MSRDVAACVGFQDEEIIVESVDGLAVASDDLVPSDDNSSVIFLGKIIGVAADDVIPGEESSTVAFVGTFSVTDGEVIICGDDNSPVILFGIYDVGSVDISKVPFHSIFVVNVVDVAISDDKNSDVEIVGTLGIIVDVISEEDIIVDVVNLNDEIVEFVEIFGNCVVISEEDISIIECVDTSSVADENISSVILFGVFVDSNEVKLRDDVRPDEGSTDVEIVGTIGAMVDDV